MTSKNEKTIVPLEGAIKSVEKNQQGVSVIVRLKNPGNRALHYISDVRGLDYDSATKKLTVRLSDEGRTPIPSALAMLPRFQFVDPNSEAELMINLPETIVKLGTSSPSEEVNLKEHKIADAAEVTVEIAWSDTPFYQDPRARQAKQLPAAEWQQGKLSISHKISRKQ